jgi:RES domain-containing protein
VPEFVAFRLAGSSTPLWARANPRASRYNHAGVGPTQYLSLHPLTPWAEYLRAQDIRTGERLRGVRARIWALRVHADEFFDLGFDNADELGLDPPDLVTDRHDACRDFADRWRGDPARPPLLIVPSAALPGTRNLVIFGSRVAASYAAEPVDEGDIPASVVADDGRAISTLLPLVRFWGDPHAELQAWRAGLPFAFREPPPTAP